MVLDIQRQKAELFLNYHHADDLLVLLNSWDVGSSKLVEACGYKAVATTSMGLAASMGYADCEIIQLSELVESVRRIVLAVQVPVTVDFEAGFGSTLDEVLKSVSTIISTGIVGINLEDSVNLQPKLVDIQEHCEKIAAIRRLADSLGFHLVINARTDSFFTSTASDHDKLRESIERGNRYHEAGADCVFVQPVSDPDLIRTLVKEIHAPVNILCNPSNGKALPPSLRQLQDMGVARVSVGSSLMKATLALVKNIADSIHASGEYNSLAQCFAQLEDATLAYKMAVR